MKYLLFATMLLVLFVACGSNDTENFQQEENPVEDYVIFVPAQDISGQSVVVYTTYGASFVEPIVAAFEQLTGANVDVVLAGTGSLLASLRNNTDHPQADVLWGGALFTLSPEKHLFEDYISVNEEYMLDVQRNVEGMFTRFSTSARLLMINTALLDEIGIEITGYADLLQPELRGRIAITDPATSGSSFNHLVNQLYAMGGGVPSDGWDYIRAFIDNVDGIMLSGSNDVVRGVLDGDFVVGLTFEEAPWSHIEAGAPVAVAYISEGIIATSSAVAIVNGAVNRDAAQIFIDFVTSYYVQRTMETELFRRPARADVPSQGVLPGNDELIWLYYDIDYVLENRDVWLAKFAEIWDEINAQDK